MTESTAQTADVHAFIESLSKRVAPLLYGTLTVPARKSSAVGCRLADTCPPPDMVWPKAQS